MSRPPTDSGSDAGLALISVAVAQIVLPILAGVWLDDRNGWSPWGAVIGTGFGFASLAWTARKLNRRDATNDRQETRHGGQPPSDR